MNLKLLRPSWRKVLADLTVNKTRTLLVVSSISVGVFAVGAIVTTYTVMSEDIAIGYASAQPANIEVITDPFDDTMVKSIERIPGVTGAEGRHMLSVRVGLDGEAWKPLDVVAADDFTTAAINLLTPVDGTVYPEDRELMVRKDQMNSSGLQPGDEALVQLTDGTIRRMPVVGAVGGVFRLIRVHRLGQDAGAGARDGVEAFEHADRRGARPGHTEVVAVEDDRVEQA